MILPMRIETERMVLRPPRLSDAASVFGEYAQDPAVTRYLTWRPHADVAETRAYLDRCEAGWASGRELIWALTFREHEAGVIGMIGLRPAGHKADIGYVLGRRFWGRGLMPEAGRAVLAEAFRDEGVHRIWAVCDVENTASARVLDKLGMTREGLLCRWIVHPNVSPLPRDALVYAVVRADGRTGDDGHSSDRHRDRTG
jgi:[ribosomal protein S5]-alanine N-acetyltransferase